MSDLALSAIHHLTVNVRDVERSERWYSDVLGFVRFAAFERPGFRRVIMRQAGGNFTIGINRHDNPEGDTQFDERHTAGLDHFALLAANREALDDWVARFDEKGVSHGDVHPGRVPGSFLVAVRDPDNIQIEIHSPPPAG